MVSFIIAFCTHNAKSHISHSCFHTTAVKTLCSGPATLFVNYVFSYVPPCFGDSSPREARSFCLWSFSSLWTQAEGPGQATVDCVPVYQCGCCVQDSFVGPGMHSLAVKSTAWLWLIVLYWVSIQPVCHILTTTIRKNPKKGKPTLFWPNYPNRQTVMTPCDCLFSRNGAGNDATRNLAESGVYFTWVLLSRSHLMTISWRLQAVSGLRHTEMSFKQL